MRRDMTSITWLCLGSISSPVLSAVFTLEFHLHVLIYSSRQALEATQKPSLVLR